MNAHAAEIQQRPISLSLNTVAILPLAQDAATVIVGNPGVANVQIEESRRIMILGQSVGQTNLIVLDGEGKAFLSAALIVVPANAGRVTVRRGGKPPADYVCSGRCFQIEGGEAGGGRLPSAPPAAVPVD
ncbi:pilus assembly protein N-terminal domain-containing protein [Lacibacterium aquatile]|uniref:Pilus assembly protein N-terminal domain-containing protein n=1 Tax=Lacibacterium aquatile TaxID=1168082 RepID=A0ABW5DT06_9PROT